MILLKSTGLSKYLELFVKIDNISLNCALQLYTLYAGPRSLVQLAYYTHSTKHKQTPVQKLIIAAKSKPSEGGNRWLWSLNHLKGDPLKNYKITMKIV